MKHVRSLIVSSLFCLLAVSSQAQVLINLTPSAPPTIRPGETISFSGTLTNTGGDVFVNGDELLLNPPLRFAFDDTPLLTASQLFPLTAGSSYTGPLFSITAPNGIINGSLLGKLTLLGGADTFTTTPIGSATFRINAVPEPGSMALLAGLGVSGSLFALSRRRRRLLQNSGR